MLSLSSFTTDRSRLIAPGMCPAANSCPVRVSIARATPGLSWSNARVWVSVIGQQGEFARAGALFSYGADIGDLFRRAAAYVDLILKGKKPAEMPIQLPTKFELIVNLKTARALGLTVPPIILVLTDEVIE